MKGEHLIMAEILLTRVDNRLIHGQVATMWTKVLGANLLLVANDAVANDEFKQSLMNMAAPATAKVRYYNIEDTCKVINEADEDAKIFIIVETPEDVLRLVENGAPIKKVNIGNMHANEGTKEVAPTVNVSDEDVAAFKKLQDAGVELEIKRVPDVSADDLSKLFA